MKTFCFTVPREGHFVRSIADFKSAVIGKPVILDSTKKVIGKVEAVNEVLFTDEYKVRCTVDDTIDRDLLMFGEAFISIKADDDYIKS